MTASLLPIVERKSNHVNSPIAQMRAKMLRIARLDLPLRKAAQRAALDYGVEPEDALDIMVKFLTESAANPASTLFQNTDAYILRAAFLALRHSVFHERRRRFKIVLLDDSLDELAGEDDDRVADDVNWSSDIDRRARDLRVRLALQRLEPALREVARAIMEFDDEIVTASSGRVNAAKLARKMGQPARTVRRWLEMLRLELSGEQFAAEVLA